MYVALHDYKCMAIELNRERIERGSLSNVEPGAWAMCPERMDFRTNQTNELWDANLDTNLGNHFRKTSTKEAVVPS